MEEIVAEVKALFFAFKQANEDRIEKLPQSGSDRIYFRIYAGDETYIATFNLNIKENVTFIYFSHHFTNKRLPMPQIFAVNEEKTIYLQEDLGTECLLDKLERHGHNDYTYNLYRQTLRELAKLQITGDKELDYNQCLTAKEFGKQAILSDLLYFKYYFLDTLKTPYDKQAMLDDFEALSNYLNNSNYKYFLFRDFQSRNVIVSDDKVHFIDYQGGMKGALQYDVASLLWQAKANLSEDWKDKLLDNYIDEVELLLNEKIDREMFLSQYNGYVLIRLLQVLGAYGFRGLFERKAHFLTSIPLALRNLKFFIEQKKIDVVTPEFDRMLKFVANDEMISRFENVRATESTPLVVKISSFSYKKKLPVDDTENGGGFVFDMRGILNPGRFEEYKCLTGRDKEVKDFLEQRTKIADFMNSVFDIVDIAVEDYIKRGFSSLMVSFGCTGGQHRSVYAADAMARHLKNKFGVKVQLCHLVQDEKNWCNTPTAVKETTAMKNSTPV
ncbi:RapZ C-terminal domain-containing protein [Segetibacter koreensis]|uniref:RapZ C-terminal domain-containing protein n=1 Tax=Segetibacter koreensis TaxID=398037 RepID=UPI0003624EB1|nr:RNase adapter RapZ [Segetibacter koreensis]